ncbi:MAG: type II toxin-antitoxin system RelE/ParE family toxin [Rickettsiales bacterium]|nr:type II toxin-antitoxin system RelE/ParE family toxin [Rickettsiales bacterium]
MKINQTRSFKSKVKILHQNQKIAPDKAIDPSIGQLKKGDLSDVRVYKFKMQNQLTLLAYLYNTNEKIITLLALGTQENFYSNLKRK